MYEIEVSSDEPEKPTLTKHQFETMFTKAVDKASAHFEQDTFLKSSKSRFGAQLLNILSFCVTFNFIAFCKDVLFDQFYSLFANPAVTSSEREKLFSNFHSIRSNKSIQNKFLDGLKVDYESKVKCIFYQKFLDLLLQCVLNEILLYHSSREHVDSYKVSDSEQQILFYIAGFILKKLEGFSCKVLSNFKEVISSFSDRNIENLGFVKEAREWTEKLDRGGLKYPCKYLYLLIREIDFCINSNVNIDHLSSQSLCIDNLLPIILESYMVKHYFKLLTEKFSDRDCMIILKYILKIFITIKGFALAKRAKNKMLGKDNAKRNSCSLRGGLKT